MKFQYYPSHVNSVKPLGYLTLEQFIRATRKPKNNIIEVFKAIAKAEADGNKELKAKLKQSNLYYFTPAVHVDGYRRYDNITSWTGLAVLDFDHIDNAADFKEYFFLNYSWIIAAWLSPSKRGVKALAHIPVSHSTDEFKDRFNALSDEVGIFEGFDDSSKNCVLPLFQSYDPELLHRDNYSMFKGIRQNFKEFDYKPEIDFKAESKQEEKILKIIDSGVDKIVGNGHPQLRGLAVAVGGYVAAGYIDFSTAIEYINQKISNNRYLSKGVKGYQRTAKQMINYGLQKPIEL